ncbi:PIN domain-containing protein [Fluviibacter phosphoraccumulans]|uniref:PIN domain-containing protein n=1 Tax=Fluviibacter phosphoraccumulans TaxID=1751046 RepID=UPI0013894248|nr:PIN domain-containing protein [Fluviibacter phosphoraccumulans]
MIVILDSNIWLAELGLNSSLGAATRFYLRQQRARIALPEVVRREVQHNFRSRLKEFVSEIAKNHRQLLAICGSLKEVVLPDDSQIEEKVEHIFSDLGVSLIEVPFSIESAQSSFLKTVYKVPPSDKTQEFKDGVLWADCCGLLEEDDVSLVTNDKAFFANRDFTKGLAANLVDEVSIRPKTFKIFASLSELISELKTELIIDKEILLYALFANKGTSIDDLLTRTNYRLGETYEVEYSAYVTENPNLLYLEFTVEIVAHDATAEDRPDGSLVLRGDANLNTESSTYESIRVWEEELSYNEQDGGHRTSNKTIYAVGNMVLGHKEVSHSVRHKLA